MLRAKTILLVLALAFLPWVGVSAAPPRTGISLVGSLFEGTDATGTVASVNLASHTFTAGNAAIVWVGFYRNAGIDSVISCADGASNSWDGTSITHQTQGNFAYTVGGCFAVNMSGGGALTNDVVTVTFSAPIDQGYVAAEGLEYSGIATSSPFDTVAGAFISGGNSPFQTPTFSTSTADSLVSCIAAHQNGGGSLSNAKIAGASQTLLGTAGPRRWDAIFTSTQTNIIGEVDHSFSTTNVVIDCVALKGGGGGGGGPASFVPAIPNSIIRGGGSLEVIHAR